VNPRLRLIMGCGAGLILANAFPLPFVSMFFGGLLAGFIARRNGWLCGLIIPIPSICISALYQALFVTPPLSAAMSTDGFFPPGGSLGFFFLTLLSSIVINLPSFMIAVVGGLLGQVFTRRWSRFLSRRGGREALKIATSFTTALGLLAVLGILLVRNTERNQPKILRGELTGTIIWCDLDRLSILRNVARDESTRTVHCDYPMYGGLVNPIWDPARSKLIVSEWPAGDRRGRRLCFLERNGQGLTHIIGKASEVYDYPALSPDGTRLAFLMHPDECAEGWADAPTGRLMLMDMAEKEPYSLLPVPVLSSRPSWGPDSETLIFATTDSLMLSLHLGTGRQDTLWHGTNPSRSPDGRLLAYYDGIRPTVRSLTTGEVVYTVPRVILLRSQGGPVQTFWGGDDELVWSPDSRYLLFYASWLLDPRGVWLEHMVARISDCSTLRLPGASGTPTGACWFE
jgi:hypothetical protein